jgi:hypothetical protein
VLPILFRGWDADDGVGGSCSNFIPRSSAASSSMAVDASSPSTGHKLVAAVRSSSMVRLGGDLSADCCCGCSSRFEASCGNRGWNLVPAPTEVCSDGVGMGLWNSGCFYNLQILQSLVCKVGGCTVIPFFSQKKL